MGMFRFVLGAGLALLLLPGTALAEANPGAVPHSLLCRDGVVDRGRLLDWIDGMNSLFLFEMYGSGSSAHMIDVLDESDVAKLTKARGDYRDDLVKFFKQNGLESGVADKTAESAVEAIRAVRQDLYQMSKPDGGATRAYAGSDGFNVDTWLRQPSGGAMRIVCGSDFSKKVAAAAGGSSASGSGGITNFLDRFRVRGGPDTLTVYHEDPRFGAADKATISFSYDGIKKVQTDVVQATIGFDLLSPMIGQNINNNSIVLYGAVNRNVSTTGAGPAKFSTRYTDFGVAMGFAESHSDGGPTWANQFSFTPHYLLNDLDGSRLVGLHFQDSPIFVGRLNSFFGIDDPDMTKAVLSISPNFDLRGDADFFTDRGSAPATNKDYVRIGSNFGFALKIRPLMSDISVSDTWMYGAVGTLHQINDFQASWTVHFDPKQKYFGLSFTYKSGKLEATANKEQSFMVSLTGKY